MTHERCMLCAFWSGTRCTQTWRLTIHVEPNGGQVDFSTVPGMVPEELKIKLTQYFQKIVDRLLPVIDMMPVWEEIREFQSAKEERKDCPARKEIEGIHPYLKVVKMP